MEKYHFNCNTKNSSKSLKRECIPELVGILEQEICGHMFSPSEAPGICHGNFVCRYGFLIILINFLSCSNWYSKDSKIAKYNLYLAFAAPYQEHISILE